MGLTITIDGITGQSPYNVYVCQSDGTGCFFINQITSGEIPYTFNIPSPYDQSTEYMVKIVDGLGCVFTSTESL